MNVLPASDAIRKQCLECMGGSYAEVRNCDRVDCPLWYRRHGCSPQTAIERGLIDIDTIDATDTTYLNCGSCKAIREFCKECGDGTYTDVNKCDHTNCLLWPYRLGCRPATAMKRGLIAPNDLTDN